MGKKIILALIVNLFLAMSIYSLITINTSHAKDIDQTSHLRFTYFIGIHAMVFISVFVMARLDDVHSYAVLAFVNCFAASLSLIICETDVRKIQSSRHYNYRKFTGKIQKLQLTFLNVYFLVYMYALIGLIITSIFLIATEILICWQEYVINSQINKCLTRKEYSQGVKGMECSICLMQFERDNKNLIEINICMHMFHEKCIIEWLKHSKTCPLDRKGIFQFENQQFQPDPLMD